MVRISPYSTPTSRAHARQDKGLAKQTKRTPPSDVANASHTSTPPFTGLGYTVGRQLTSVDLSYIKDKKNRRFRQAILTALAINPQKPSCVECGHDDHRVLNVYAIDGAYQNDVFRNMYAYYIYVLEHPEEYGLICANCQLLAKKAMVNVTRSVRAAIRAARYLEDPDSAPTPGMVDLSDLDDAKDALRAELDTSDDLPVGLTHEEVWMWRAQQYDHKEGEAEQGWQMRQQRADELLERRVSELLDPGVKGKPLGDVRA